MLPLEYAHGASRFHEVYNFVDDFPLISVNTFVRRALLGDTIRQDGKYHTGMIAWAWFIWERKAIPTRSVPIMRWIDNNEDVLRDGFRLEHKQQSKTPLFDHMDN